MPKPIKISGNFIKLILITVASMGLTIVSSFILAHMLSVEDRGAHQLFITTVTYVVTFSTGGVGFALALSMRNQQYLHWWRYFSAFLAVAMIVANLAVWLFDFTRYDALFVAMCHKVGEPYLAKAERSARNALSSTQTFYFPRSEGEPNLATLVKAGYFREFY